MPHIPPIKIRELEKRGLFKEEDFYRLLSEQNNYVDHKTMRDFYMGLVRLMTQQMRKDGVVMLPHIGHFALVKQKDKVGMAGKMMAMLEGKYMLKFYPISSWKEYFSKLSQKPGIEGRLDPREKILGQIL